MEIIKAIILGIVQGATEFLPVSSSGHLVLGSKLLNFQEQGVLFDVFLHLGTLGAVLIVFRQDLQEMIKAPFQMAAGNRTSDIRNYFLWDIYVIVGTLPVVIIGLFLKDYIDTIFSQELLVYAMLFITACLMMTTPFLKERDISLNCPRSFLIGIAQATAVMPGLSRSGSTIFAGMALGINRKTAARFAFIMSVPAILGAVVLKSSEMFQSTYSMNEIVSLSVGTLVSAVTGYFAIVFLLDVVEKNRLQWFGYYCLAVSLFGFASYFLN